MTQTIDNLSQARVKWMIEDEIKREVISYLATWDTLKRGETVRGEPCWYAIDRGAFDRWLADTGRSQYGVTTMEPGQVRVVADHEGGSLGSFRVLGTDSVGLKGLAIIDDNAAGEALLDACDSGDAPGFSFRGRVLETVERDETRDGLPIFDVTRMELVEAGPTPDPADEGAVILSVGGQRTEFLQARDALERDQRFRQAIKRRP